MFSLGCRFCRLWLRLISLRSELWLDLICISTCNSADGKCLKLCEHQSPSISPGQFYTVYTYILLYIHTYIQIAVAKKKKKGIKTKVIYFYLFIRKRRCYLVVTSGIWCHRNDFWTEIAIVLRLTGSYREYL